MPNPTRRSSVAYISPGSRTSAFLQLLKEINDTPTSDHFLPMNDNPTSRGDPQVMTRRASLNCNVPPPTHQPSVWAKGGSTAEDARQKLRALDEARQRKLSADAMQFANLEASCDSMVDEKELMALPTPLLLRDFQFSRAATFSATDAGGKRGRSDSPDFLTKKIRQDSFSDMTCRNREYYFPSSETDPDPVTIDGVRSAAMSDPILRLDPLPDVPPSPSSPLYDIRATPKHAYKFFAPVTPCRSPIPSEEQRPVETPTWARPLHLVEGDDFSIYKNVHGDKAREHPLCLYCFRRHGEFRKMIRHHCEVCDQTEVLEGYYREASP